MTNLEAIEICERWFRHLENQRQKSLVLQKAAALARQGNQAEARRLKNSVDRQPKVFDGATLEPAVRHLCKALSPTDEAP